ncbi:hypothetical protein Metbo_1326 [Methanobacterium lacus]|uniref:Uncharacterized protein n=1 Tax=Methanobacterium lacus (strain AL-21) TaxID=877455 RepID=F0T7J9_METLA|nr:hypothetical protein [Methanobacterium lacus]ADZ09567.1 hypothetical protein Metbo_1326 [Methanobacterium lacus]
MTKINKEQEPSLNTLNRVLNGTLDIRNEYIIAYEGELPRLAVYLIQHDIPFEFSTKGRQIKIPIENVHIESNEIENNIT